MSGSGRLVLASSSSSSTASDGSPRRVFVGLAVDADDVAEVDVDRAGAVGRAEELDLPRAVDEVEEDELAVPAAPEHPPGDAARLVAFLPGLELLRLGPSRGDLVPLREALRQRHDARV